MERPCNICSCNYLAANNQSMFCSDICKKLGRNARLKRQREEKYELVPCASCSEDFLQTRKNIVYCSELCKIELAANKPKKEKSIKEKPPKIIKPRNKCTTTKTRLKKLITESRMDQGVCAHCDETDIRLFEFAHYSRKDKSIVSVSQHQNLTEVRLELEKGRWLCVWCHRLETKMENDIIYGPKITTSQIYRAKHKHFIDTIKVNIGSCNFCMLTVTLETCSFFEFDHIDPSQKSNTISNLIGHKKSTILAEIEKCRLLCCRCHRLRTIKQMQDKYAKNKEAI
jgi:hypothetical protein